MADFRYQCTGVQNYSSGGDLYIWHFRFGILFALLYPVGIPTFFGVVIFLKRSEIRKGKTDTVSAIKRLYEDYKPDHCMCAIFSRFVHWHVMMCTSVTPMQAYIAGHWGETGGRSISLVRRLYFAAFLGLSAGARSPKPPWASFSPSLCC
eukprot:SAG11_NODE_5895_length_1439_cov_1.245522_2_plen_150_part_00